MILNACIAHQLIKEQHKDIQESDISTQPLDCENEKVQQLVDRIDAVYGNRYNARQYGAFSLGADRGTFPDRFEAYITAEEIDAAQFVDLTKEAMDRLYQQAKDVPLATGGYLVFADLTKNGVRYFLAAMIKEKPGMAFEKARGSNQLTPEELMTLNLDKLHQGLRVNLNTYQEFLSSDEQDSDQETKQYLNFISSKSTEKASAYFITAFGCFAGQPSNQATDTVIKIARAMFRDNPVLKPALENLSDALLEFLSSKAAVKEPVELEEIVHKIRRFIPEVLHNEADSLLDDFFNEVTNDANQVPVRFAVSASALNKYTKITGGKDQLWKLTLERSAIGTDSSAAVQYNPENQTLTLRHIPEGMRQQIEEAMSDKQHD